MVKFNDTEEGHWEFVQDNCSPAFIDAIETDLKFYEEFKTDEKISMLVKENSHSIVVIIKCGNSAVLHKSIGWMTDFETEVLYRKKIMKSELDLINEVFQNG